MYLEKGQQDASGLIVVGIPGWLFIYLIRISVQVVGVVFINSLNKCLLSTHYVSRNCPRYSGYIVNKTGKYPCSHGGYSLVGETSNKQTTINKY